MRSKKRLLKNWRIYAILDDGVVKGEKALMRKFRELLRGGSDAVQLRFKSFPETRYRLAARMVREGQRTGKAVIVNDRPELALALGADGVHAGKGDVCCKTSRALLGAGAIIGRTGRNARDARTAEKEGADYIAVGPVFATPIKPGLKPTPRRELKSAVRAARIPVVAIGGINTDNVGTIIKEGIRTVAFVRYGIVSRQTESDIQLLRKKMGRAEQKGTRT